MRNRPRPRKPTRRESRERFRETMRQAAKLKAFREKRPIILELYRCLGSPIGLGGGLRYTLRSVEGYFECYFPDGHWVRGRKK